MKMKNTLIVITFFSLLAACSKIEESDEIPTQKKWMGRTATISKSDSLFEGITYLSVYSHIYSISEHRIHDLTATISLRNTSRTKKIYIKQVEYYNTSGKLVKSYLTTPTYLNPMETVEVLIFESNESGGTGGNFIFDWATASETNKPYFEAIMISTLGQQGLSFTTSGVEINK